MVAILALSAAGVAVVVNEVRGWNTPAPQKTHDAELGQIGQSPFPFTRPGHLSTM